MIFSVIFAVLSVLFLGYYLFAALYAGFNSAFLWFWLLAGVGCAFLAVLTKFIVKYNWLEVIPRWIKILIISIIACGIALFVFLESCVISGMFSTPKKDADYVIVLGAQVRGTRVTKSLAKRLDAAYEYAIENENCIIIVSGGQGTGEDISEAEAMKKYLIEKGIDESRIVMEDKSTTTKENLLFSKEIVGDTDKEVVIATNNFHVFRAKKLAEKLGYENISAIPAESDSRLIINYMVRDALAILKEKLMGNI